jgi:hypothetical protein
MGRARIQRYFGLKLIATEITPGLTLSANELAFIRVGLHSIFVGSH